MGGSPPGGSAGSPHLCGNPTPRREGAKAFYDACLAISPGAVETEDMGNTRVQGQGLQLKDKVLISFLRPPAE